MTTDNTPTAAPDKAESKPDPQQDLAKMPIDEVHTRLDATSDGLSGDESATRLAQYGPNETAEHVQDAHMVSHFQKAVLKIGNHLILLAVVLVTIILVVSILCGNEVLTTLQFALVLTVAAIPMAMPAVLSVTRAVGARKPAKKQAIVSKLVAIEELAGVDVLCADKTGTLTQNALTLGDPFCTDGISPDQAALAGALVSRAGDDDPIDLAVLDGDLHRRLRAVHDVARMGVGGLRLGLRYPLGVDQRPHQAARVPHPRPAQGCRGSSRGRPPEPHKGCPCLTTRKWSSSTSMTRSRRRSLGSPTPCAPL